MALRPAARPSQNAGSPFPRGDTTPEPVMTGERAAVTKGGQTSAGPLSVHGPATLSRLAQLSRRLSGGATVAGLSTGGSSEVSPAGAPANEMGSSPWIIPGVRK